MKKLGFGLMRLPQLDADHYGSVDVERVKKMADLFMEHGFTGRSFYPFCLERWSRM